MDGTLTEETSQMEKIKLQIKALVNTKKPGLDGDTRSYLMPQSFRSAFLGASGKPGLLSFKTSEKEAQKYLDQVKAVVEPQLAQLQEAVDQKRQEKLVARRGF